MNEDWYLRGDEPSSSSTRIRQAKFVQGDSGYYGGAASEQEDTEDFATENDRSGAEDGVETEPGSWSSVQFQPEDDRAEPDDVVDV